MFEQPAIQEPSQEDKPDDDAKLKEKRYRFYAPTDNDLDLISRSEKWEWIRNNEQNALNERPLKSRIYQDAFWYSMDKNIDSSAAAAYAHDIVKGEKEKDPETVKEIRHAKERIMSFTNRIGIDRSMKSFPDDEDIYIKDSLTRETAAPAKNSKVVGNCSSNEIEVLKMDTETSSDNPRIMGGAIPTIQHELVHSACLVREYVDKSGHKEIGIGFRSGHKGMYRSLNEGMTELTNLQIFLENDLTPDQISYLDQVVFLTMLVEDMTEKMNTTSLRVTTDRSEETTRYLRAKILLQNEIPGHDESLAFFSNGEILSYFQRGLFNSDRRCLKLLGMIYGKEALKALSHMGFETEDVIDTALAFKSDNGVGYAIADRIRRYYRHQRIEFNVAGRFINIRLADGAK